MAITIYQFQSLLKMPRKLSFFPIQFQVSQNRVLHEYTTY